jgi:pyrimidine-specific ribonucleoside hydrolase
MFKMKKVALLLLSLVLAGNVPVNNAVHQKQAKRNVILDVDTSGDDLMAILYLLAQPDVDIKAITIVHGVSDVKNGTEIVLRVLALTGHPEIPVVEGADVPLAGSNAFPAKWQPPVDHPFGLGLPPHSLKPSSQKAEEVIASLLKKFRGNISILALGPLTNIASVFIKEPALAGYANGIYVSDGAVYVKGSINLEYPAIKNAVSGWNLWVDAKAAAVVFGSDAKITLVPLDLTAVHGPHPVLLKSGIVKQYNSKVEGKTGQSLSAIFNNWITYYHADTKINGTEEQAPVWDLVAAEIYCNNEVCTEWQDQKIEIKTGDPDTDGQIVLAKDRNPNVRICLKGNQDLFDKCLLKTASSIVPEK